MRSAAPEAGEAFINDEASRKMPVKRKVSHSIVFFIFEVELF